MSTRALILATLPVAALLAVVSLIGVTGGGSPSWESPLVGVSTEYFVQLDLELPERGARPEVTSAEASEIARRHYQGEVRQVLLARIHRGGALDRGRLVWVVSFDPKTIVAMSPSGWSGPYQTTMSGQPDFGEVIYSLLFVDAATGESLTGHAAQQLPDYMR
ncbi:MAG: hypothetical protein WD904_14595 [Dehalococcoidia bacterium]